MEQLLSRWDIANEWCVLVPNLIEVGDEAVFGSALAQGCERSSLPAAAFAIRIAGGQFIVLAHPPTLHPNQTLLTTTPSIVTSAGKKFLCKPSDFWAIRLCLRVLAVSSFSIQSKMNRAKSTLWLACSRS